MAKKRKDECLFCGSRTCSTRIYRRDVPIYDEIACDEHISDLEKHSDEILGTHNRMLRNHVQGTGKYKRGEVYNCEHIMTSSSRGLEIHTKREEVI